MPTQEYKLRDGRIVPGTTTVIGASLGWNKGPLMWWAYAKGKEGKPFREEANKAAETGTYAHALAEAHIKAKPLPEPPAGMTPEQALQAHTAYEAFLQWERMSQLVLEDSEIPLVSEEWGYGGTLDGVGQVSGQRALLDLKGTNGTYSDHVIQVAAYAKLWLENRPNQPLDGGVHILRLGKDEATFSWKYFPVKVLVSEPFTAFLALRQLYSVKKKIESLAK